MAKKKPKCAGGKMTVAEAGVREEAKLHQLTGMSSTKKYGAKAAKKSLLNVELNSSANSAEKVAPNELSS